MQRVRYLFLLTFSVATLLIARPGVAAAQPTTQSATHEQPYKDKAGPCTVETVKYDWHDGERDRDVPVKIYYPKTGEGPCPVIVFSHGLGGSREGYEYLGRHWAGYGYVCVHPTHKGTDTDTLRAGKAHLKLTMLQAAANPRNAIDRAKDVTFMIDELGELDKEKGPLSGRLDLKRLGVAGHSFGANTTLAVIGEVFIGPLDKEIKLADPRVKAAIAMSSPVPGLPSRYDQAFGGIRTPCLHMTGTNDMSPVGDTQASQRRIPFDHIHLADQYLVIFKDADHMVFGVKQPRLGPKGKVDKPVRDLILQSTTAFWDAYLRDDAKAKRWLTEGGFEAVMDGDGTFEKKLPDEKGSAPAKLPTSVSALLWGILPGTGIEPALPLTGTRPST